ncbi:MAG: C40 family peptidase [Fibrobacter sp.]|nr:C40 family peptidase [Fibrobacter sp.]
MHFSSQDFFKLVLATLLSSLFLSSCSFPARTGYDRRIGDYRPNTIVTETVTDSIPAKTVERQNSVEKKRKAATHKEASRVATRTLPPSKGSLEDYIKPWLGTRYRMGGTTKAGIDCSGYVMQIYKGYYNIALKHNAEAMFKDGRGHSVRRGNLQEGDLIFFGDFWGINHVGIYLKGDRFTHASNSKGVTITAMTDKYWSGKYKGARRFR